MVGKNKKNSIVNLVLFLASIVLINYCGSFVFKRFDLTSEKRYTLSTATTDLVTELDDVVYIKVYLDGELPAGFQRLKNSIKETLDELRAYSDGKLEYEFKNPSEDPDEKIRNSIYQELSDKGLQYTNLEVREGDKYSEQIIFPGAIIGYKGKEIPVQLLKSQLGADQEVMLNNSIQQLEYEFASAIKKLLREKRYKIAFLEGHGELIDMEVADIAKTLDEFYAVERAMLDGQLKSLSNFDAIVVAKPDSAFSEKDKFIIDQFVMNGGKVLWFMDHVFAEMDSLQQSHTTVGIPMSVNLEDMFFKYGFRINTNLILDLQSLPIPIVTGYVGNQPKQELFPWFYFPLIMNNEVDHPIVKNLDAIKTEFVSSIDTVGGKGIKKTVLLRSSAQTKLVTTPTRISLNMLRVKPDERQFNKQNVPLALLLEGEFNSLFANRLTKEITNNKDIKFKEKGKPTKMIVVADGDVIKNPVNKTRQTIYPLGYDKFTDRQYANKDFILNAMNYLFDDEGLIQARSKEFKIRLLNKQKVDKEKEKWQLINTVIPILLIALFGFIQFFIRQKTYNK